MIESSNSSAKMPDAAALTTQGFVSALLGGRNSSARSAKETDGNKSNAPDWWCLL